MAIQQADFDLVLYRGDSRRIQMEFTNVDDETGVEFPVDLTNLEVKLQARYEPNDPVTVFELPWTLIDAKKGIGYFTLKRTLSESLVSPYGNDMRSSGVYDIQFWSKIDPEVAFTPIKGNWSIGLDVTRKK